MKRVLWTSVAVGDLERAVEYIADTDPVAATTVAARVLETCERLGGQHTGRPGRVAGTFEKVVSRTPYVVAYVVGPDAVTILRVIHVARNWTAGNWPDE